MLVLSRKPGQKLQIGDNITITVLEVHGHVLRLGIEAPREVRVLRAELQDWQRPEVAPPIARKLLPALAG
jgi:carbon storage regulator